MRRTGVAHLLMGMTVVMMIACSGGSRSEGSTPTPMSLSGNWRCNAGYFVFSANGEVIIPSDGETNGTSALARASAQTLGNYEISGNELKAHLDRIIYTLEPNDLNAIPSMVSSGKFRQIDAVRVRQDLNLINILHLEVDEENMTYSLTQSVNSGAEVKLSKEAKASDTCKRINKDQNFSGNAFAGDTSVLGATPVPAQWSDPTMTALAGDWQCGKGGSWTFFNDGRASIRGDGDPKGPIAMARWPNRMFFQYSIAGDEIRLREIYQVLKPFASDYNEVRSVVTSEILVDIGHGLLTGATPPDIQIVYRAKIDGDRLRMLLVSNIAKGIEQINQEKLYGPIEEALCTRTLSMDHGPIDPALLLQ